MPELIAGRYSLDRELGRGGMGAVWLGRDEVLGREVAVKRLGMAPGTESPDQARAEREARLAARLSHPHVVAVYDLVEEHDQLYLVMEYVEGTNLSGLLRARGPLLPDAAGALLGQAADALAAAHEAGIVHRDVKPSNMLVTDDGQLKLSDFGIARGGADPSLTQTGLVTGSPAYLAPEVASGASALDASDVWSLGASLFHALTGHPPYEVTDNVLGALYRIVHEEPPRIPEAGWLAPVLEATMHRDPAARWPMAEVRDFLLHGPAVSDPLATQPLTAPSLTAPSMTAPSVTAPSFADPSFADPSAATGGPDSAAAEAHGTAVLASVPPVNTGPQPVLTPRSAAAASSASATGTAPATSPAPSAAAPASTPGSRRRRGRTRPILLGLVAGMLLVVVAFALGQRGDPGTDEDDPAPRATASEDASRRPQPATLTRGDLADFATSYVATAVEDPRQGFDLLTPAYQEASDGLEGYMGFWGSVVDVVDIDVTGTDVENRTVTYTYTRVMEDGQEVEETVQLTLEEQEDGRLLIAGAP